jgi:hypothetical protein
VGRHKFELITHIDKLEERDQIALFNLMQTGIVSRTLRSERVEKRMTVTVFATANTDETLLPPLLSRFFAMYLHEYTDEQFKELAVKSVAEQIEPELAMHIAVSVLSKLNSRDLRDAPWINHTKYKGMKWKKRITRQQQNHMTPKFKR